GGSAQANAAAEAADQPAGRSAGIPAKGKRDSHDLRLGRSRKGNSAHSDRQSHATVSGEGEAMRKILGSEKSTPPQPRRGRCAVKKKLRSHPSPRRRGGADQENVFWTSTTPAAATASAFPSSAEEGCFLLILSAILLLLLLGGTALAQDPPAGVLGEIGVDQKLNAPIPKDLLFKDESGRDVRIGDFFHGKPVILTLVYYECPMLCSMTLNGLVKSLRPLAFTIGDEFEVVTVSFDP